MRFSRLFLLAVFMCGMVLAQQSTVAKLVEFVKSSIQQKNADKDVAGFVSKMKLTEKLSSGVVEELQAAGAGPRTVAALQVLLTQSASLAAPAPKVVTAAPREYGPSAPSAAEQKDVLQETREWALNYTKSLPDFLCLEVTNRSLDTHYQPGAEASWTPNDRLIEKLTFFDHKESYELFQHNETAVAGKTSESLGGSRSTGEWASLLGEIFEPATNTDFHWVKWGTMRGQLTYVYEYKVEQRYSQDTISHGDKEKITAGFHGQVFIEKGTNVVLRVTIVPDIPPDFPIQDVDQTVDYDYQNVGTQRFLLPYKSEVKMRDGHVASLNQIQWRSYRKYSADTNITFDSVDDPPPAGNKK